VYSLHDLLDSACILLRFNGTLHLCIVSCTGLSLFLLVLYCDWLYQQNEDSFWEQPLLRHHHSSSPASLSDVELSFSFDSVDGGFVSVMSIFHFSLYRSKLISVCLRGCWAAFSVCFLSTQQMFAVLQ